MNLKRHALSGTKDNYHHINGIQLLLWIFDVMSVAAADI